MGEVKRENAAEALLARHSAPRKGADWAEASRNAARGRALLAGRGYVIPQDVKDVAFDILRHRVLLTYEAAAEERTSEEIIAKILDVVAVP